MAADLGPNPHLIGIAGSRGRLNSPALLLDLDALERNIANMAAFAREHGIGLRPHSKTHKSVEIARRQIAAGALGICCATQIGRHTSELQSLMRISYAVFCLKKKNNNIIHTINNQSYTLSSLHTV